MSTEKKGKAATLSPCPKNGKSELYSRAKYGVTSSLAFGYAMADDSMPNGSSHQLTGGT